MAKSIFKPFALTVFLCATPAVLSAATVTLTKQQDHLFGTNGSAGVIISDSDQGIAPMWVAAGGFAVTDGASAFTAWCVDIATRLRLPSQYRTTTTPFPTRPMNDSRIGLIGRLFSTAFSSTMLHSNAGSAGFQLALWEIVNENGTGLNLGAGNFTASNNAAAIGAGQGFLDGLTGAVTQPYRLTFLASDDPRAPDRHYSQNLVTAAAVPLPAAGGLFLAALGGLGVVARRRKAGFAANMLVRCASVGQ